MSHKWIKLVSVAAVVPIVSALATDALVAYPDGYRSWTHAKSMVIQEGHSLADPFEGIHHTYANEKALAGLARGEYENGAVFVFDLLDFDDSGNAIVETGRKFIGVMEFDTRRFAETGGWGFEAFAGDSRTDRVVADGGKSCFGCHVAAEATNYVFTTYRE